MSGWIRPLELGSLTLPSNIIFSPLAGCSDWPFRKMALRYRAPGLLYCEMVKMDALVRNDPNTFRLLDYSGDMHPIGAQLCGSKVELVGKAARIVEELGFDVIDLNCGCPVDKVTKDSSGSGLLRDLQRIGDLIAEMVAAVRIPVTVKIRAGWDEESIVAPEITEIAEEAGAVAIAIHGRTRKQAYRGLANRQVIGDCKQVAKRIKVLGNGDIFDPPSAVDMFEKTGCDGILVSRGTMGNPWIVDEIESFDREGVVEERTLGERKEALLKHLEYTLRYHCPRKALVEMRRVACWYMPRSEHVRAFRRAISHAESIGFVRQLIEEFPAEAAMAV